MSRKIVPAAEARTQLRISNSRFIATIGPAFDVKEARAFVGRIREEFDDATHNVPAFIIGHGSSIVSHSSDDGEPSGTAGRPALAVLQGSGLGDVVVVVTRYFGGTKLGTGGLVRAYGDAVRKVLEEVERAEKVLATTVSVNVPYHLFERARLLVETHGGQILGEVFAADVMMTARFRNESLPLFGEGLRELTNGKIREAVVESDVTTIVPFNRKS